MDGTGATDDAEEQIHPLHTTTTTKVYMMKILDLDCEGEGK
jgi:hypothetical protein